ncbi:MAG TPA: DUF2066 domain-containing protein [Gammaproteobacteria bacterium]|nr:DUF2066 domain-containing protein [Gammaproteobacteria bacterium]
MTVKRLRPIAWMLLAVLTFPGEVYAAMLTGLYEVRVPVVDRTAAARRVAVQQGLAVVLVKVTGERNLGGPLVGLLSHADQYVQQYRYEQAPPDTAQPNAASAGSQSQNLVLWAKFDADVVNQAAHGAGAPVWGTERPRTLVWLAVQEGNTPHIINAGDSSFLVPALVAAADQRGLSLVLPQMDGPDRSAIGLPDVTGFMQDRLLQASARYKPDAVLVGTVTPFGTGQYAARWQLLYGGAPQAWETPPAAESDAATDGVEGAADRYAQRLAIPASAGDLDGVSLAVDGVTSLDAYGKLLHYLEALTPVRAVHVERVEQGSVYFGVDVHGTLDVLEQTMVLGGLLTPATNTPAPTPLRYRYAP